MLNNKSLKVLFAYNGRVEVDKQGQYYGNELNDSLVERYQFFGERVSFLVRTRPIQNEQVGQLQQFKNKYLTILPVPEHNHPRLFLRHFFTIRKLVKQAVQSHDVIIARQPSIIGRFAVKYARQLGKPYMIEAVGCPWDALFNYNWLGKIYAPYAYMKMKSTLKSAPYVLYVTDQFLQRRYPNSGHHVGVTDVVLGEADPQALAKRLERTSRQQSGAPLILGTAAGLDVPYKGQAYVVRAIALLKSKGLHFKYQLIGKGNGNAIKRLAKELGVEEQVEVIGQIPHNRVFAFFDEIDIYVQPSKQEGLPRSMVEAMSRACPCIGSNAGGIPELLDDDCVFPKGNYRRLAEILEHFSQKKLLEQAKRNYELSLKFELSLMEKKRHEFYEDFRKSFNHTV